MLSHKENIPPHWPKCRQRIAESMAQDEEGQRRLEKETDFDEVSTGDGARKPKRPDTRPDFAKPNYREPRSPGRGGGRGRGRGGGRGRGRGEQRGRNEQTYVRRERQSRHWDAFMEDDANELASAIAPSTRAATGMPIR